MKCKVCNNKIHPYEKYGDFYYCDNCKKTYGYRKRSKPVEVREDFVKHDYMLEVPKAF